MSGCLTKIGAWSEKLAVFFLPGLFYGMLLLSLSYWVRETVKFHGVKSWPKVPATILEHGSGGVTYRMETRTGTQIGHRAASWVKFSYSVEGTTYQSDLGSPNGGGVPVRFHFLGEEPEGPWHESWEAYYDPDHPEVAVLSPVPYDGTGWLVVAFASGSVALVHAFFWVKARIRPTTSPDAL
jgi:hypothetical protein